MSGCIEAQLLSAVSSESSAAHVLSALWCCQMYVDRYITLGHIILSRCIRCSSTKLMNC